MTLRTSTIISYVWFAFHPRAHSEEKNGPGAAQYFHVPLSLCMGYQTHGMNVKTTETKAPSNFLGPCLTLGVFASGNLFYHWATYFYAYKDHLTTA